MSHSAPICLTGKRKYKKGFTLVETVIVATIFSFIAAGIATSFVSGMKLWSRAKEGGYSKQNMIFAVERISQELRQAVNIPAIGLEGSSDTVSFASVVNDSVVKVTYKFDASEKMLSRKEESLKDILKAQAGEKESDVPERKIMPAQAFSLKYLCFDSIGGTYEWKDTCEKDKDVFVAVKFEGKSEKNAFTKTVFIPSF